jgi:hypothetical protein
VSALQHAKQLLPKSCVIMRLGIIEEEFILSTTLCCVFNMKGTTFYDVTIKDYLFLPFVLVEVNKYTSFENESKHDKMICYI